MKVFSKMKSFFRDSSSKIMKKDLIIIGILVLIYMIISIFNLGTFNTPKTYYQFTVKGQDVALELVNSEQEISKIRYYTGPEVGEFDVIISSDGENYTKVADFSGKYVFSWEDVTINKSFKYIKFVSNTPGSYLGEVQLYDQYGNKVLAKANDDQSTLIIDEMDTVPVTISSINSSYFDEIYFARSAYEYINGIDTMEWVHPPLGKLIMMIPILLFGMSTFSYRIMGVIAGAIMIPVIYTLAKRMFKNRKWALLAGILMTFDCFHFAQSRMGTVDTFLVLFIMLSALFMYQYIELDSKARLKDKFKNLFFSGLFIGCAIATKWTGLYAGLALAIIFFTNLIYRNVIKKEKDKNVMEVIFFCILSFVVVPIIIYVLGYLLFPNVYNYTDNSIKGIIYQIADMYKYHSTLTEGHDFSSNWYTWPLMIKPVWYYVGYFGGNIKATIVGIGNPAIWWFGALAAIFTLIISIIKRKKENLFTLIFILCTWLPYLFIDRAMFMYHFYPTLPFIMLAIVSLVKAITNKIKNNSFYIFYVAVVILMFILFYPIISGMITNSEYINSLKWLSSWIF